MAVSGHAAAIKRCPQIHTLLELGCGKRQQITVVLMLYQPAIH
jgi:hypothetical protein